MSSNDFKHTKFEIIVILEGMIESTGRTFFGLNIAIKRLDSRIVNALSSFSF